MTRATIQKQLEELKKISVSGTASEKRERGRQFEIFLKELLDADGLDPRIRIRPDGEEIDGSFVFAERVFLLEAKWHANPLPASSIYQFRGKVEGKLLGTLGIFISMSGFSEEAVDALTYGKGLNAILFDERDIDEAISSSFKKVLQNKLRAAGEEGVVYLRSQVTVASSQSTEMESFDDVGFSKTKTIFAIVEGYSDEIILAHLARAIFEKERLSARLNIIVAGGKLAVGRLSRLTKGLNPDTPLIVVADSDGDRNRVFANIREELTGYQAKIVIAEPDVRDWLQISSRKKFFDPAISEVRQTLTMSAIVQYADLSDVSIERLRTLHPDFAEFYDALVQAARHESGYENG